MQQNVICILIRPQNHNEHFQENLSFQHNLFLDGELSSCVGSRCSWLLFLNLFVLSRSGSLLKLSCSITLLLLFLLGFCIFRQNLSLKILWLVGRLWLNIKGYSPIYHILPTQLISYFQVNYF